MYVIYYNYGVTIIMLILLRTFRTVSQLLLHKEIGKANKNRYRNLKYVL